MSKYSQQEQVSIIYDALMLQTAIEEQEDRLDYLGSLKCPLHRPKHPIEPTRPSKPIKRDIDVSQIAIVSSSTAGLVSRMEQEYTFIQFLKDKHLFYAMCTVVVVNILASVVSVVGLSASNFELANAASTVGSFARFLIFWFIVGLIPLRKSYKTAKYNKRLADPEYQAAFEAAKAKDEQALRVAREKTLEDAERSYQSALDKYDRDLDEYRAELDKYNHDVENFDIVTELYNKGKEEWDKRLNEAIKLVESDKDYLETSLANLYDTTKLVSLTYRERWILSWLYNDMNSSDHDIRYATELLDRDRQRCATERVSSTLRSTMSDLQNSIYHGVEQLVDAVNNNTKLMSMTTGYIAGQLENINDSIDSFKKQQGLAEIVSICQRWSTNKEIKKISEYTEKKNLQKIY